MKTLITIVFFFIFGTCFSQSFPPKIIIGNPIKIEKINKFGYNLEITQYDFPIKMNWEDAKNACRALGDGWRLPNVPELLSMGSKGFITNTTYWSSEEYSTYNEDTIYTYSHMANVIDLGRSMSSSDKTYKYTVRAIRNLDTSTLIASDKILDNNFENSKIGNLEIALNDFPKLMTREEAIFACSNLGSGWRLPNKDELNMLFKNKYKIGGFKDFFSYWSSTADPDVRLTNKYFYLSFKSGDLGECFQNNKLLVRAVKSIID